MLYIWQWFLSASIGGSNKLTYTELKAWAEMMNIDINAFECETIIGLDRSYWNSQHG